MIFRKTRITEIRFVDRNFKALNRDNKRESATVLLWSFSVTKINVTGKKDWFSDKNVHVASNKNVRGDTRETTI